MTEVYQRLADALSARLAAEGVEVSPEILQRLLWGAAGDAYVQIRDDR